MKMTPVYIALQAFPEVKQVIVHTGQHYDDNMSKVFFDELGLSAPDINLEVGSGSHAAQTGQIMMRCEDVMREHQPDMVLVYGDVNSTVAAAMVCSKLWIPVGHVEAGLRSFDRRMPEEINRLLTDQISDVLFTPSLDGNHNLEREGIPASKVHFVGNPMIDTLVRLLPPAEPRPILRDQNLSPQGYALVTLHHPSNVDNEDNLRDIMQALQALSTDLPIIFPVHPRTLSKLTAMNIALNNSQIRLLEPLGYLDFLCLQKHAKLVITDSGGIQEETTYLQVPCLTLRENTERPVTVEEGTNQLIGRDMSALRQAWKDILTGQASTGKIPDQWDGNAGMRVADIIVNRQWEQFVSR